MDYFIKLNKDVSIVGHLYYAAFVGPLIVLSLVALRTENLLFHRCFCSLLNTGYTGNEYDNTCATIELSRERPLCGGLAGGTGFRSVT